MRENRTYGSVRGGQSNLIPSTRLKRCRRFKGGGGRLYGHAFGVKVQRVQKVHRVQRGKVGGSAAIMNKTFTTALTGEGKAFPLARFAGLLLKGSVSLDSQSPKGSLRIQIPCHPASGGRTTRA